MLMLILWGNKKSQVEGPNFDNSPLERKQLLSPVLYILALPEQISATFEVQNS